jgi:DNA-binding NtrC family response regulator
MFCEHEILKNRRVLVVDDEPDVLETVKEILDMCLIDSALSYDSAKKLLEENDYDVVILDIMGVRGYDLLDISTRKGIHSVMLTAHALSPENFLKSIKKGAKAYLPKNMIIDIATYLVDIIEESEEPRKARWFRRLKPFFDRQFGPDW